MGRHNISLLQYMLRPFAIFELFASQFSIPFGFRVLMNHPPFSREHQLCNKLDDYDPKETADMKLPGNPWLSVNDTAQMERCLQQEFIADALETMASRLWVMSTQSSANINPLHRQRVKGRQIVITEEPRLHLYLLSYNFWDFFLAPSSDNIDTHRGTVREAALGYLRTYRHLIQHESDFRIAQQDDLRLIPKEVTWASFCQFISTFDSISDNDVSQRYHYGELRLARLNFYAPLFLRKFHYEQVYGEYSDYFARLYGPILFVFAIVTTLLNCMQVALAVEQVSSKNWVTFWGISRWSSIVCLVSTVLVLVYFAILWAWMILDEWVFALRDRLRKRHEKDQITRQRGC